VASLCLSAKSQQKLSAHCGDLWGRVDWLLYVIDIPRALSPLATIVFVALCDRDEAPKASQGEKRREGDENDFLLMKKSP